MGPIRISQVWHANSWSRHQLTTVEGPMLKGADNKVPISCQHLGVPEAQNKTATAEYAVRNWQRRIGIFFMAATHIQMHVPYKCGTI